MAVHQRIKKVFILLFLWFFCSGSTAEYFRPESVNELIMDIILANSNGENDVIDLRGCEFKIENVYPGSTSGLPAIKPDNVVTTTSHTLTIKDGTIEISLLSGITARHFDVNVGASLYLEQLKLKYGSSAGDGGSINNSGFVSLKDVALISNMAAGNGGAIVNNGMLSIGSSTFNQNSAVNGGAIYNGSQILQLFNSTFANNMASGDGGAIESSTGGINSMTNNTIASNTASKGGGIYLDGSLTLANNVSALAAAGTITVFISNIVAANTATTSDTDEGFDIYDLDPGISNPQYNLVGIAGHSTVPLGGPGSNWINTTGSNNLFGVAGMPLDPMLGILQYNGGRIWTMALLPTSPAINAGKNPLGLRFDERGPGYVRTSGGATDIGAYEYQFCELDSDHDGVCNENDNCPCNFNPDQADCNHNGIGDCCDECPCPCMEEPCDDTCGPCPCPPERGPCDDCHRCPREGDGRDGDDGYHPSPPENGGGPGEGGGCHRRPCDGGDCHRRPCEGGDCHRRPCDRDDTDSTSGQL